MTAIDLSLVVDCAALAPSVHNTQPWLWTAGDDVLTLRADRSRRLHALDRDERLLHISCGAATEFARLAVRSLGRDCSVQLLPDPADADVLARLVVGAPRAATDSERALVEAMPRRYTDRGPYDDTPVPLSFLRDLRDELASYDVWTRLVDGHEERAALAAVLSDAEAAEAADPDYADELARWVRAGSDGVSPAALGSWPDEVVSEEPLRRFVPQAHVARPGAGAPPEVRRDTVVVLGTDADGRYDWLAAGRALAWLQLRATVDGLATQPLGPATDFPAARARLRRELSLTRQPQFVLRVGYGHGRPRTGRRWSDETLVSQR